MSIDANIMSKLRLSQGLVLVCVFALLLNLAVADTVRTAAKSAKRSPELAGMNEKARPHASNDMESPPLSHSRSKTALRTPSNIAADSLRNAPTVVQRSAYAYRRTLTNISAPPVLNDGYSTAGTYTWPAPAGVTSVTVECWGAGGGGGAYAGGGGGGGAYSLQSVSVTPGNNYSLSVGSGGAGAANGTTVGGSNGGDSFFASTVLAKGGTGGGGYVQPGGAGGSGSAGIGSTKYSGGTGGQYDGGRGGGGGGSSAGTAANGNTGVAPTGGTAPSGGGAGGNGGLTTGGANGSTPGGGGGGGGANFSDCAGGNGAAGKVVITYNSSSGGSTGGGSVSVTDFGAVGDGSTDDSDAIISAIAAAATAKKVVFFPPGTYIISKQITIPAHVTLWGTGMTSTILKRKNGGASFDMLRADGARITIRDLTVDGNKAGSGNTGGGEIVLGGDDADVYRVEVINSVWISIEAASVRPTIRYCILTGNGANGGPVFGIWTAPQWLSANYHGQDVTVDHCLISTYLLQGIYSGGMTGYNTSVRPHITDCIFIDNNNNTDPNLYDGPGGAGQIDVEGWAVVRGCKFLHEATTHSYGIEAHFGGVFTDNLGIGGGSDRSFMEIQGGGPYTVTGNTASGYGSGIDFNQGEGNIHVTDYIKVYLNDFTGCVHTYTFSYGSDGTHNYIVAPVSEISVGANVASASTISPSGALFHITGATTITNISTTDITKGTELKMITESALTFTNGNLAFNGGATSLTTSAGDMVIAVWDGTKWRLR